VGIYRNDPQEDFHVGVDALFDNDVTIAGNLTVNGSLSGVTKAMVGLTNVDDTADANKPVSTAQQAQLDLKAPLDNPTFTGTVAGVTKAMVGLTNVDDTADANKPVSTAQQAQLDLKAPLNNPTFTGTVAGVTKAMVGLGSVDNTSDADKPVSTAQANEIATKVGLSGNETISGNKTFTGTVNGDTLTDGTATLHGGELTALTLGRFSQTVNFDNVGLNGTSQTGDLRMTDNYQLVVWNGYWWNLVSKRMDNKAVTIKLSYDSTHAVYGTDGGMMNNVNGNDKYGEVCLIDNSKNLADNVSDAESGTTKMGKAYWVAPKNGTNLHQRTIIVIEADTGFVFTDGDEDRAANPKKINLTKMYTNHDLNNARFIIKGNEINSNVANSTVVWYNHEVIHLENQNYFNNSVWFPNPPSDETRAL
jgi:hypothetical protein